MKDDRLDREQIELSLEGFECRGHGCGIQKDLDYWKTAWSAVLLICCETSEFLVLWKWRPGNLSDSQNANMWRMDGIFLIEDAVL